MHLIIEFVTDKQYSSRLQVPKQHEIITTKIIMKVIVKKLQGKECSLDVLPTTLISDIKKEIAVKLGIPVEEQKLLLLGRPLADEKAVQTYSSIKDGTKINLVVKKPDGIMEVSMKYFRKQGLPELEAKAAANKLLKVLQEKFNKLSWDDIDRLVRDCMKVQGIAMDIDEIKS